MAEQGSEVISTSTGHEKICAYKKPGRCLYRESSLEYLFGEQNKESILMQESLPVESIENQSGGEEVKRKPFKILLSVNYNS